MADYFGARTWDLGRIWGREGANPSISEHISEPRAGVNRTPWSPACWNESGQVEDKLQSNPANCAGQHKERKKKTNFLAMVGPTMTKTAYG